MTRDVTPARRRIFIEELEPRMLYSADLIPVGHDGPRPMPQAEYRVVDASGEFVFAPEVQTEGQPRELVFVDARTPDLHTLLHGIEQEAGERYSRLPDPAASVVASRPDRCPDIDGECVP